MDNFSETIKIENQPSIENKIYPKILSNLPNGKDLYKAESHQKIASTIINIIESQGDIIDKQIIGLEGDWGTGKSNIIKIIEEKTKNTYHHFTYDTWTHQEDLTRKSILQELICFLKKEEIKVIDPNSENWKSKEDELTQRVVIKNTRYFPQLKGYYIFLIIAFLIIKFGNETLKQVIGSKVFGFYDNSINYLIDNFYIDFSEKIKWEYILKLFPFILITISIVLFVIYIIKEIKKNQKALADKKLTTPQLIGKIFYWVSGEKLESNSNETIKEDEPSNLRFRRFLKEIDDELVSKKKILLLTIDNTDRLTDIKLKNIWSTINIFFAESSNAELLKNIWLIIPYDEKKVLEAFVPKEIGVGLLEKTFAITFKVPPPLISNWESFFDVCFDQSFKDIELKDKLIEIEILKRIFEHFQDNITPRKIINFINKLATYYIQNSDVKLRYFSIVILNSEKLFSGSINDNIIDRIKYLDGLDTLFVDDDKLELNLAKIIYGINQDEQAEEALLHSEIDNLLKGNSEVDEKIINTPSFNGYFDRNFRRHLMSHTFENQVDSEFFALLTKILIALKSSYFKKNQEKIYTGLWEFYYKQLYNNKFYTFSDTHVGVLIYCSKKNGLEFINQSLLKILQKNAGQVINEKDNQIYAYLDFLKKIDNYFNDSTKFKFNELKINIQLAPAILIIDLIKEDKALPKKYKIKTDEHQLKTFLINKKNDQFLENDVLIEYQNEIIFLKDELKLNFIVDYICDNWIKRPVLHINEVNSMLFYIRNIDALKLNDVITSLTLPAFNSLIKILQNSDVDSDLSEVYYLIFLNYNIDDFINIGDLFQKSVENIDIDQLKYLNSKLIEYKEFEQLIGVFKAIVDFNSSSKLLELGANIIRKNYLKLNEFTYNWLLQNYSYLESNLFSEDSNTLYKFLNKRQNEFSVDIQNIDLELINNTKRGLNLKLIKLSNDYLVDYLLSNKSFLQNNNTKEYLLFSKLLVPDKLNKVVYENLYESFIDLVLSNREIPKERFDEILKIKSELDSLKLVGLINDNFNKIFIRPSIRPNLYIISPEIFNVFDRINNVVKTRILKSIISYTEFYSKEFIDEIIKLGDINLLDDLRRHLETHTDENLISYAISKGVIESSRGQ